MKLEIDEKKLVERLADMLVQHEERLLSEVVRRIDDKPAASESVAGTRESNAEIMGIRPHALYPVSFVADRWDVSQSNVRKKTQEELPRSGWKGGEIRYRGIDILRYEGVNVEEHVGESPARLETELTSESPESRRSNRRPSPSDDERENGHPYNSELPALSDEEPSPD